MATLTDNELMILTLIHGEIEGDEDIISRFSGSIDVLLGHGFIQTVHCKKPNVYETTEKGIVWIGAAMKTPVPVPSWRIPNQ